MVTLGRNTASILLVSLAVLLAGCGQKKEVGSEKILDFEEQKGGGLGAASPTPSPQTGGQSAPAQAKPAQPQAADQKPQATFFDVGLIAQSPYYEPGDQIAIARGTTLRVTNKDNTAERPQRSFTAQDGSFDSGMLKPGQVWTQKFDSPGVWRIEDKSAPFISATLEVR
jgi:hypothetical protein